MDHPYPDDQARGGGPPLRSPTAVPTAAHGATAAGTTTVPVDTASAVHPKRVDASPGQLVADVARDVSTLVRQEVELAKAELREEATKLGKGAGMFGGAAGAGSFALIFLLLAAMFGLGEVMALGWAALIVAGILLLAAAVLALSGRSAMRSFSPAPTRTVKTLKEDVRWARNRTS